MIAPLKDKTWLTSTAPQRQLRRARRLLADMLLTEREPVEATPTPAWQAWLLCTWVVVVAVAYLISMARSFQ